MVWQSDTHLITSPGTAKVLLYRFVPTMVIFVICLILVIIFRLLIFRFLLSRDHRWWGGHMWPCDINVIPWYPMVPSAVPQTYPNLWSIHVILGGQVLSRCSGWQLRQKPWRDLAPAEWHLASLGPKSLGSSIEDLWRSLKIFEDLWRSLKIFEDLWRSLKSDASKCLQCLESQECRSQEGPEWHPGSWSLHSAWCICKHSAPRKIQTGKPGEFGNNTFWGQLFDWLVRSTVPLSFCPCQQTKSCQNVKPNLCTGSRLYTQSPSEMMNDNEGSKWSPS